MPYIKNEDWRRFNDFLKEFKRLHPYARGGTEMLNLNGHILRVVDFEILKLSKRHDRPNELPYTQDMKS